MKTTDLTKGIRVWCWWRHMYLNYTGISYNKNEYNPITDTLEYKYMYRFTDGYMIIDIEIKDISELIIK